MLRERSAKYCPMAMNNVPPYCAILGIYARRQQHNQIARIIPTLRQNLNMAGPRKIRIFVKMFYLMHVPRIPLRAHIHPVLLHHC